MYLCTKDDIIKDEKLRFFMSFKKQLAESDIIIIHDDHDAVFLDVYNKPSIYYCHRAARPITFMYKEIIRMVEPVRGAVIEKDYEWILERVREWFKKPDVIVANSKFIKRQIKKYFGLDAFVVYPPVDLNHFRATSSNPKREYFLSVQRINWQKRVTLQIEAFKKLDERLRIVGALGDKRPNPDLLRLVEDSSNIEVLGGFEEKDLPGIYTHAKATIQTGYCEDFGLVPVESMACGTPCIVVDEGGFKETVHSLQLGIRIKKPYVENLRKAVQNFDINQYNSEVLRKEAEKYGLERFRREMEKYMKFAVERHENRV